MHLSGSGNATLQVSQAWTTSYFFAKVRNKAPISPEITGHLIQAEIFLFSQISLLYLSPFSSSRRLVGHLTI